MTFIISDAQKEDFWTALAAEPRPRSLTDARMKKLKVRLWHDADFWDDIIARHGGLGIPAKELRLSEPAIYAHCLGNFHGMLVQTAWELWRVT